MDITLMPGIFGNGTQSYSTIEECVPDATRWHFLVLMPLSLLAGLVNIVIWMVATIYKRTLLQQSYVYTCVTSTLLSNVVFISLQLWDQFAGYLADPNMARMPASPFMQVLWTLCHAGTVATLYVMSGNLFTLIYVLLDSAYFQSNSSSTLGIGNEPNKTAKILSTKRKKAIFLIALSWLLPLGLTIAAVQVWNCAKLCRCAPGALGEICPKNMGCSRVYAPLSNSYLGVNVVLWLVEVIFIIVLLVRGIESYLSFSGQSVKKTRKSEQPDDKSISTLEYNTQQPTSNPIALPGEIEANYSENNNKPNMRVYRGRRNWFQNQRLRLVTLLTASFLVGTIPVSIAFLFDVGLDNFVVLAAKLPTSIFLNLYTIACPVLLVKYMSNLKQAIIKFLTTLLFCFN